jgi:hypothetical protein
MEIRIGSISLRWASLQARDFHPCSGSFFQKRPSVSENHLFRLAVAEKGIHSLPSIPECPSRRNRGEASPALAGKESP